MSKLLILGGGAFLLAIGALVWRSSQAPATERPFEIKNVPPQAAPLCPWREPEADLKRFFPNATRYEVETLILSGSRGELAERLGRIPTGDENALRLYRVFQETELLGCVMTQRVKGEYGAIELVLGLDTRKRICGMRLQRMREPEPVAHALENSEWLGSFTGKDAASAWKIGVDLPEVPTEARVSAEAVVHGARSLLVLLEVGDRETGLASKSPHH
jgi:hypothetical protein